MIDVADLYDRNQRLLPPLAWLVHRWAVPSLLGRILAGPGQTAVPMLEVGDAVALLVHLLEQSSWADRVVVAAPGPERVS